MVTVIEKNAIRWYAVIILLILTITWVIAGILGKYYISFSIVFQLVILYFLFSYLRLPTRVILNTKNGTIEVQFLYAKNRLIHLEEIESFSSDVIKNTKSNTRYEGVVLNLKTGGKILISEINLHEYVSVYIYLVNANIPNLK